MGCCRSQSWRCSSSRAPPWGWWCPRWPPPGRPWTSSARSTSPTSVRVHSPACPWWKTKCYEIKSVEKYQPQENHPCVILVVHWIVRIGRIDPPSAEHPENRTGNESMTWKSMRGKRCYGWSLEDDKEVLWQRKKQRKKKRGKKMSWLYKESQKRQKNGAKNGAKRCLKGGKIFSSPIEPVPVWS